MVYRYAIVDRILDNEAGFDREMTDIFLKQLADLYFISF